MSYSIKYKNHEDRIIEEHLAVTKLKSFITLKKLYYKNETLVKEELYEYGKLSEGVYFMGAEEDYERVFNSIDASVNWEIKSNKQIINDYEVWESRSLENMELSVIFWEEVYKDGRLIASKGFDTDLQPLGSWKILYLNNIDDSGYTFYFDQEGLVTKIIPSTWGWDRPYDRLSKFLEDDPIVLQLSKEQLDYYTKRDPLIPDNGII